MLTEQIEATRETNAEKYCQLVGRFPALVSESVLTYLKDVNYFTAPSSFKKHGAWIGGNFDHSCKVTEFLLDYTAEENLKWEREESPYIIGLFHDMCKCDERGFAEKDGGLKVISLNAIDKRHAEKSIELIEDNIITMTTEERLCIYYHMGIYGGDYDYQVLMDKMIDENPNIRYVQMADTVAARMGI